MVLSSCWNRKKSPSQFKLGLFISKALSLAVGFWEDPVWTRVQTSLNQTSWGMVPLWRCLQPEWFTLNHLLLFLIPSGLWQPSSLGVAYNSWPSKCYTDHSYISDKMVPTDIACSCNICHKGYTKFSADLHHRTRGHRMGLHRIFCGTREHSFC